MSDAGDGEREDGLHTFGRPAHSHGLVAELERALVKANVLGLPGPTVGRYQVQRKIGGGGMAVVFAAHDPHLSRSVALKVLRSKPGAPAMVDIQHEARALARIDHPNVVAVYDIGVERDQLYVCMPLVDGGDVARWLDRHGPVDWRRVVRFFTDAARGLHVAHEAGVVHGDFKLENLLVGPDGVARVTDFGLARLDGEDGVRRQPSPDGTAVPAWVGFGGTPGYIAPEVLAGQAATAATDQYALFVALDRALAGAEGSPPAALRSLIAQGVDPDPARRHADLAVVREALLGLLGHQAAAGQRAREFLCRRVRAMWIEGVRDRAVAVVGQTLPIRTTAVPDLLAADSGSAGLELAPGDAATLADALRLYLAGVLLLGAPGSGKSVHLLEVTERLLDRAEVDETAPLPFVLNLSSFLGHRGSFRDWLHHEMVAKYALSRTQVVSWVDDGHAALLLDGLDELAATRRAAFIDAFHAFRAERPLAFVITCREDEYRGMAARLRCDVVLRAEPLDPAVLDGSLPTLGSIAGPGTDAAELVEQLRNPLMLTLFLQLRESYPELTERGGGPRLRERLYDAAVTRALDMAPAIPESEREAALAGPRELAQAMSRVGVTELWLEEMQMTWLARPWQRWLANGLALLVALAGAYAVNLPAAWAGGQSTAIGLVWGTASAGSAFAINRGLRIVPMEAMAWSWSRFRRWVPYNVAMGIIAGTANGFISGEHVADATLGAVTGLLGMSMIGLVPSARQRRVRPNEGMRESMRNAFVVAPLVGLLLFVGIGYGVVPLVAPYTASTSMYHTFADPGLTWGLTMGVAGGYATWLATGMWAPIAHTALRVVLALTSRMPLRLEPWLDGWARRDLLRRVGGGWMFRHQTLRAWLEARDPASRPAATPPPASSESAPRV